MCKYARDVRQEARLEHRIRLIENEGTKIAELSCHIPIGQVVIETARSGDQHGRLAI